MRIRSDYPRQVRELENVWIPLPDGSRLAAKIWLPEGSEAEPVPAILEYIPYRKNDWTWRRDSTMHPYFAGQGYACVRVDLRGAGESDGVLLDEYLEQELDDGAEAVAWIAAQPWCTGAVGMFGISWGGFNGLQIAARRPPALKTVITLCSTDDRYADDVHYMGGCLLGVDMLPWASLMYVWNGAPPDPEIVGDGWREMWLNRLAETPPYVEAWLTHQRRDAYWQHGSVCEDFSAIECPVYAIGGWVDGYSNAIPRLLEGLPGTSKGLIGPWGHGFPHDALPGPQIGFLQECLRWWDRWLKGEENVNEPRVAQVVVVPDTFEEELSRENLPRSPGQLEEEPELGRGQLDPLTSPPHLVAGRVDLECPDGEHLLRRIFTRSPHDRPRPGDELGQLERLRDVVVGAELEPDDHVDRVAPGRQHHDRNPALTADLAAHLEAVELRKHHVEDDKVERPLPELDETLPAVGCRRDREAGLRQAERRHLPDRGIVLHEQHALVHRTKPRRRGR